MLMNADYADGNAKLLLAQSYEKSGEQDKANLLYQELVEKYKNTDVGAKAQEALDAQNKKTPAETDADTAQTAE